MVEDFSSGGLTEVVVVRDTRRRTGSRSVVLSGAARRRVGRVGVDQTVALAANREASRVVRALQTGRAVGSKVDRAVGNVASSVVGDTDGKVVPIDKGDVVPVVAIRCAEGELGERAVRTRSVIYQIDCDALTREGHQYRCGNHIRAHHCSRRPGSCWDQGCWRSRNCDEPRYAPQSSCRGQRS